MILFPYAAIIHQREKNSALTILHCLELCLILLYCTVLYCSVLYHITLHCPVVYWTVLYCTVLYCTVLYCTVLYCTVLYCTVHFCTVLYFSLPYCSALQADRSHLFFRFFFNFVSLLISSFFFILRLMPIWDWWHLSTHILTALDLSRISCWRHL